MDFKKKSVEDMLTWLENKGYSEWVRESFEGQISSAYIVALQLLPFHRK